MSQYQSSPTLQYKLRWIVIFILLAAAVCGVDQFTKNAVDFYFIYANEKLVITTFFNIVKTYNTGASFGLLDGFEYSNQLFLIINTGVILALFIWLVYNINCVNVLAVGLIIGGAIGNLIDRVVKPGVLDFIQLHWREEYYYPAFNIADSAIVMGVIILIITSFKES